MNTKQALESMGFKVDLWTLEGDDMLQITNDDGITFYQRADCTIADALNRYRQKLQDFYGKQTTTK